MTDKIEAPFEREMRYIVLKIKDVQKYVDGEGFYRLRQICDAVAVGRARDGRPELACVVVESDWPEYEAVWAMIEARVSGNPSPADEELRRDAERMKVAAGAPNLHGQVYLSCRLSGASHQQALDLAYDAEKMYGPEQVSEADLHIILEEISDAIAAEKREGA